jgi:hypothetical protein
MDSRTEPNTKSSPTHHPLPLALTATHSPPSRRHKAPPHSPPPRPSSHPRMSPSSWFRVTETWCSRTLAMATRPFGPPTLLAKVHEEEEKRLQAVFEIFEIFAILTFFCFFVFFVFFVFFCFFLTGYAPYTLTMQNDGNLVLTDSKSQALWTSGSAGLGFGPYRLKVRDINQLLVVDRDRYFPSFLFLFLSLPLSCYLLCLFLAFLLFLFFVTFL